MAFESTKVTIQSGKVIPVAAWDGSPNAGPLLVISDNPKVERWIPVADVITPARCLVHAQAGTSLDLLHLVWEFGEPVDLVSEGSNATTLCSDLIKSAAGAVSTFTTIDAVPARLVSSGAHALPVMIFRGRQNNLLTHEDCVIVHEALGNSLLVEPEYCSHDAVHTNPEAVGSALNMFFDRPSSNEMDPWNDNPVDPKQL